MAHTLFCRVVTPLSYEIWRGDLVDMSGTKRAYASWLSEEPIVK